MVLVAVAVAAKGDRLGTGPAGELVVGEKTRLVS